jgi:hypothetical protein
MDEHTLTREFDRAVRGEPPLGFDPDDAVNRAERHQRRRRMTTLAAGGVAAIALVAVAVPLALGHDTGGSDPATIQAATVRPSGQWPPTTLDFATLSETRLGTDLDAGKQHLGAVLPAVLPNVTSIVFNLPDKPGERDGFVGQFGSVPVTTKDPRTGRDTITDSVTTQGYATGLTVKAGPGTMNVAVSVAVPLGTRKPGPLAAECDGLAPCLTTQEPDGGILVQEDAVLAFKPGSTPPANGRHQDWLTVTEYRPDGTIVSVESTIDLGAPATQVLPTVGELTKLAVDPAFRLTTS